MATPLVVGDLKNNLKALQSEIRHIKYPDEVDIKGISKGNPQAFLPLYNYIFNDYNNAFTQEIVQLLDDGLYGKSDLRFVEAMYRILRDLFNYKPSITKEQFFSINNFAERKIMMCGDILRLVRERCRAMGPYKFTNPNIRVTSVVNSRRTSKGNPKSSTEIAARDLSPHSDNSLTRKTIIRPYSAGACHQTQTNLDEDRVKNIGYVRPKFISTGVMTGMEGEGKHRLACKIGTPKAGSMRTESVEVVTLPASQNLEAGHMRVMDVLARNPDHSVNESVSSTRDRDRDQTDAMETILAKVRDLPTQLANFMQAVESRLLKVEVRLGQIEDDEHQDVVQNMAADLKQKLETLHSRFILLDNRIALLESKAQNKELPSSPLTEGKKNEIKNPFLTLELGEPKKESKDDSFSTTLVKEFSPVQYDDMAFSGDFSSLLLEPDSRHFSTPTQSQISLPSLKHTANTDSMENLEESSTDTGSLIHLDASTQQQIERIKGMLENTKQFFPVVAADNLTA